MLRAEAVAPAATAAGRIFYSERSGNICDTYRGTAPTPRSWIFLDGAHHVPALWTLARGAKVHPGAHAAGASTGYAGFWVPFWRHAATPPILV